MQDMAKVKKIIEESGLKDRAFLAANALIQASAIAGPVGLASIPKMTTGFSLPVCFFT